MSKYWTYECDLCGHKEHMPVGERAYLPEEWEEFSESEHLCDDCIWDNENDWDELDDFTYGRTSSVGGWALDPDDDTDIITVPYTMYEAPKEVKWEKQPPSVCVCDFDISPPDYSSSCALHKHKTTDTQVA